MTKRKMNSLIAIGILALYIICLGISFNTCLSLECSRFERISKTFIVDRIETEVRNAQYSETPKSIDDLIDNFSSSIQINYPYTFGIYDEEGKLIFKNGIFVYNGEKTYAIDEYFTDEIKDIILDYDNDFNSHCEISRMEYYIDDNGLVPVRIFLKKPNKRQLSIPLSTVKQNKTYINDGNEVFSFYNFNEEKYLNPYNRKIHKKLNDKVKSKEMSAEAVNSIKNYSGSGGGYYGPDEYEHSQNFELNGKWYYVYATTKHNEYYDTVVGDSFKSNTINQTILFGFVAIFVFVVANKLFKKNKVINETREAFTSAAAHELKTPITIINNQCECLLNNTAPEKNEEYIETIYKQNKQMSHLVSSLLQYNRLSLATIEKSEFDLKEIVDVELEKYEALIEQKGINIIVHTVNCKVVGDKNLLTLVVDNYLSNAIKHTSYGKTIKVDIGYKRFSVFNEGNRISDDDKNKIWEMFNHSINESKSTGMGLAIAKRILELHKFNYGFENKINGVEFYFRAE